MLEQRCGNGHGVEGGGLDLDQNFALVEVRGHGYIVFKGNCTRWFTAFLYEPSSLGSRDLCMRRR